MRPCRLFIAVALPFILVASSAFADTSVEDHLEDARSLYYAGHWQEADEAFQRAHSIAREGTKLKAASALEWGTLMWEQGNYERAEQLVNEALELARELGLDDATGELLVAQGHIEASKGELSSAENTLNICVQLTGELGDPVHRALCRLNRRMVRTLRGKDPGSDREFRDDVATLSDADSTLSIGTSLAKTAELYRDSGDYERATQLLSEAQQMYRDAGSVPAVTRNQLRKAQLLHHQGKFEEARPVVDGLLPRFEKMRNRPMIVHTLALQAEDAIHQDDPRSGVKLYRRALAIADEIGNPQLTGRIHLALCEMSFAESPGHCQRATEIFASTGMTFLEIRARTALARTHQIQGEFEEARTAFRQAIRQLEEAVDTDQGTHATSRTLQYANLCQVEAQLEATGALTTCTEALRNIEDLDEETRERHAGLSVATIHATARTAMQANRASTALEHFSTAAELYEELGEDNHLRIAADIHLRRGAIQRQIATERDNAADSFQKGLSITNELELDEEDVATVHISLLTQLAQLHRADEDWSDAIDVLKKLRDAATGLGDHKSAAWAYSGLASAYLQTDRRDDAVEALQEGRPLAEKADDQELLQTFDENLQRFDN